MRKFDMRQTIVLFVACCLVVAGCGGGDGGGGGYYAGVGSVSGVVFDQSGNIVRNAQVFYNNAGQSPQTSTLSNSNGAYVLKGIPAFDDVIQCQLTSNGVNYFGQNLARLSSGQRTMTVNIALYPTAQLASIQGTVGDSSGNLIYGAKIYAIAANGDYLTSSYGITDYSGHFNIGGLVAGTAYNIQVNALGYSGVTDSQTLTAGQAKSVNYTIAPAVNTTLPVPQNVFAVSYTAPALSTTQPRFQNALAALKNITHPGRKAPSLSKKMSSFAGSNSIEIDVFWNPISNTSLLGYGIYRSNSSKPVSNIDFLSDPLSSIYEDISSSLAIGTTYTYAVSSVSTSYNGNQGESALSNTATVTPLGPLALGSVAASANPTFNWTAATGAANYAVFLFSQYPDIGVTDIFDNFANPQPGTSFTYSGAPLTSGHTYYYIVVGIDGTGNQSIGPVGQFAVP